MNFGLALLDYRITDKILGTLYTWFGYTRRLSVPFQMNPVRIKVSCLGWTYAYLGRLYLQEDLA